MRRVRALFVGDALTARAGRSVVMVVLKAGGAKTLRLLGNLALTRLLFPEAFGLMALVAAINAGLQLFTDVGIKTSIIQNAREDQSFLDTAWTMQIVRGVLLWLVACALAQPAAAFYEAPELAQMIPIVGLQFVIGGFATTREATMNRHLTLERVVLVDLTVRTVGLMITIALAAVLQSVWALVWGLLITQTIGVVANGVLLPGQRNRLRWDPSAFSAIFHFGKWLLLSSVAGFLLANGDRLMLGKFITLEELGFYAIAIALAMLPGDVFRQIARTVLLPIYRSRPPAESPRHAAKIRRARAALVATALATAVVVACVGDALIGWLYDDRYVSAGPILVMLAVARMPSIALIGLNMALLAAGNSRAFSSHTVLSAVLQTSLGLTGLVWVGLPGLIAAMWVTPLLAYPFLARRLARVGAWAPGVDAAMFGAGLLGGLAALSLNWEAVRPMLAL